MAGDTSVKSGCPELGASCPHLGEPALTVRLRLPRTEPVAHPAPGDGPILLFLPAHDEEATVADVVRRVPRRSRAVRCGAS